MRQTGEVPEVMNTSTIVPIYKKKGSKSEMNNWRLIVKGGVIRSVMEKLVTEHVTNYIVANNIIDDSQYGFVKNKSTETQLSEMYNDWAHIINEGKAVHAIYLDLKGAFDS